MTDSNAEHRIDPSAAALLPATLTRIAEKIAHLGFNPVNHVLGQHQWARDKLMMHAGKTVRIGVVLDTATWAQSMPLPQSLRTKLGDLLKEAPTTVDAHIGADGTLIALPLLSSQELLNSHGAAPAVSMLVKPTIESLKGMLTSGASGLQPHLSIDGDVMLAAALGEIAQHARWDFEDDASFFVGDKAARRFGEAASKIDVQVQKVVPKVLPHFMKGLDNLSAVLHRLSEKLPAK
jgi:ubiquinone biosynthesis accessory factor UbiJ